MFVELCQGFPQAQEDVPISGAFPLKLQCCGRESPTAQSLPIYAMNPPRSTGPDSRYASTY